MLPTGPRGYSKNSENSENIGTDSNVFPLQLQFRWHTKVLLNMLYILIMYMHTSVYRHVKLKKYTQLQLCMEL